MNIAKFFDLAFGNLFRFFKEISFRKEERGPVSWYFVGTLLVVMVYGLIMLFSASYSTGYYRRGGDIYAYIRPQLLYAAVGLALMFIISNINYRALRHVYWYAYWITLALLIWALFSTPQNDCYRWVYLFGSGGDDSGVSLQPSEIAKFVVILGIACNADAHYSQRKRFIPGIVLPLMPLIPYIYLLYKEPHNSAIILLCLITGTMLVCGGCNLAQLAALGAVGVAGIYLMLTSQDNYVAQRLSGWSLLGGGSGDNTTLYQTEQSLYSIASGGLSGLGIGNSRQKHLWLPEATNDFIFSVVCEELGFIGALVCIALFAALIVQGIIIALRSPDYFGSMLGIGITAQIAWQVFCHIGVVTATLPNTGISLPFFSSGGTSLLLLLCEMGILLSISRAGNARDMAQKKKRRVDLAKTMQGGEGRTVYRRGSHTVWIH